MTVANNRVLCGQWEVLPGSIATHHNLNLDGFIEGMVIETPEAIIAHALPTRLSKLQRFDIGEVDKAKGWVIAEVKQFYQQMTDLLSGDSL